MNKSVKTSMAKVLNRATIYESDWVNLYADRVQLPSGRVVDKYHVVHFNNPSVGVLVKNEHGEILLVRIFRYPTDRVEWEIPAGGMEMDETPLNTAEREVLEETGYSTVAHELLYSFHPMNGISNKLFHVVRCFVGQGTEIIDESEIQAVKWFGIDQVAELIATGAITDGLTLVAVLLDQRTPVQGL